LLTLPRWRASLRNASTNPQQRYDQNVKIRWTNLKRRAIVGFPWPIHILLQVRIACPMLRVGLSYWKYRIFEEGCGKFESSLITMG
jgi:hypothetical protein